MIQLVLWLLDLLSYIANFFVNSIENSIFYSFWLNTNNMSPLCRFLALFSPIDVTTISRAIFFLRPWMTSSSSTHIPKTEHLTLFWNEVVGHPAALWLCRGRPYFSGRLSALVLKSKANVLSAPFCCRHETPPLHNLRIARAAKVGRARPFIYTGASI